MNTSNELPSLEVLNRLLNYDPYTGDLIWKNRVNRRVFPGSIAGCVNSLKYRTVGIGRRRYYAHRIAWFMLKGTQPQRGIDHINGDRSDNRISNLRESSSSENSYNRIPITVNSSGYKGVHRHSLCKKFYGKVCKNYKQHHTKLFDTAGEASVAVKLLRERLHGEFANHGELTP